MLGEKSTYFVWENWWIKFRCPWKKFDRNTATFFHFLCGLWLFSYFSSRVKQVQQRPYDMQGLKHLLSILLHKFCWPLIWKILSSQFSWLIKLLFTEYCSGISSPNQTREHLDFTRSVFFTITQWQCKQSAKAVALVYLLPKKITINYFFITPMQLQGINREVPCIIYPVLPKHLENCSTIPQPRYWHR